MSMSFWRLVAGCVSKFAGMLVELIAVVYRVSPGGLSSKGVS